MGKNEVKIFPRFDRSLHTRPDQLFDGWGYDDFVCLIDYGGCNTRFDMTGVLFNWMRLDGWVLDKIPVPGVEGLTSWEFNTVSGREDEPLIITPLGENARLFPYDMKVYKDRIVFIRDAQFFHMFSEKLLLNAMKNTEVPLPEALLFYGFCGVDGISEPLFNVAEHKEVSQMLGTDIPFDTLFEAFVVMAGENYGMMPKAREKMISFGKKLNAQNIR